MLASRIQIIDTPVHAQTCGLGLTRGARENPGKVAARGSPSKLEGDAQIDDVHGLGVQLRGILLLGSATRRGDVEASNEARQRGDWRCLHEYQIQRRQFDPSALPFDALRRNARARSRCGCNCPAGTRSLKDGK